MVNTPPLKDPVTPAGNAPEVIVAPVAPEPGVYTILLIEVLIQTCWLDVAAADVRTSVEFGRTIIEPDKEVLIHGPDVVTV